MPIVSRQTKRVCRLQTRGKTRPPKNYTPSPRCPTPINNGSDKEGIWLYEGKALDVDSTFITKLYALYNDDEWQLFDEATGEVRVTDTHGTHVSDLTRFYEVLIAQKQLFKPTTHLSLQGGFHEPEQEASWGNRKSQFDPRLIYPARFEQKIGPRVRNWEAGSIKLNTKFFHWLPFNNAFFDLILAVSKFA